MLGEKTPALEATELSNPFLQFSVYSHYIFSSPSHYSQFFFYSNSKLHKFLNPSLSLPFPLGFPFRLFFIFHFHEPSPILSHLSGLCSSLPRFHAHKLSLNLINRWFRFSSSSCLSISFTLINNRLSLNPL